MSATQRDKIAATAKDLFMRLGIRSVSMDDISRQLGISKKSLYQEFESKQDLLDASLESIQSEDRTSCAAFELQAENAIEEMYLITKYVLQRLRTLSPSAIHDLKKYYPEQYEKMHKFHTGYITGVVENNMIRGIEQGLYRKDINTSIASRFYVHRSMTIVDETHFPLQNYRRDELFQEHILLHMHSLVTDLGLRMLDDFKAQFQS